MSFFGIGIRSTAKGLINLDQRMFINKPLLLPNYASFQVFRIVRATVMWVFYTRLDMICTFSKLSQVTDNSFAQMKLKS